MSVFAQGCAACNCDPMGSLNATCHVQTGQCEYLGAAFQ
jgi:hypothetical protein